MSEFSYSDYEKAAQNATNSQNQSKVGFFKLGENSEALVRIDCGSTNELVFVNLHRPVFGKKFEGLANPWAGISCLNEYGKRTDSCPLCRAAAQPGAVVDKVSAKVYVKMIAAYINADGTISEPQPVVWERPAGFARELASKLKDYGNLRDVLLKITRIGSGKETRYMLDYAFPAKYNPALIPTDFSAFADFKLDRHSYYSKNIDEVNHFLATGSFSEANVTEAGQATKPVTQPTAAVAQPVYQTQQAAPAPTAYQAPAQQTVGQTYERAPWETAPAAQEEAPAASTRPTRSTTYSF